MEDSLAKKYLEKEKENNQMIHYYLFSNVLPIQDFQKLHDDDIAEVFT